MRKYKFYALGILIFFSVQCIAQSKVVISQVYGGAGCGTPGCSSYKNDYIELYNAGNVAQSLNGWSIQYAASIGTTWQVTLLPNFTLQPGQYFLIGQGAGVNGTDDIPTPDASGSFAMSGTAAKVALLNIITPLSGACPSSPSIVDFVGYGTTPNCNEGGANAPSPSTTTAILRAGSGCTDNNNNSTDFTAGTPNPRNSATALAPCTILPVLFNSFTTHYNKEAQTVAIDWSTAQEQNAKEFAVERSLDGNVWSTIATVKAVGNTSAATYYKAKDASPQSGTNLYRIKQVDVDGRFQYTGVVGIKTDADGKPFLKLYPNPGNGIVFLNTSLNSNANVQITVTDVTGKKVMLQQTVLNAVSPFSLNLGVLGKGTYFVQVTAKGFTATEKVVVY